MAVERQETKIRLPRRLGFSYYLATGAIASVVKVPVKMVHARLKDALRDTTLDSCVEYCLSPSMKF
jgi:hypothetical protein